VGVAAFESLRHLRALHQAVSGVLIDAVGAAVLFALLSPLIAVFSGVPKELAAEAKDEGNRK
jgi:hypothetical protein